MSANPYMLADPHIHDDSHVSADPHIPAESNVDQPEGVFTDVMQSNQALPILLAINDSLSWRQQQLSLLSITSSVLVLPLMMSADFYQQPLLTITSDQTRRSVNGGLCLLPFSSSIDQPQLNSSNTSTSSFQQLSQQLMSVNHFSN